MENLHIAFEAWPTTDNYHGILTPGAISLRLGDPHDTSSGEIRWRIGDDGRWFSDWPYVEKPNGIGHTPQTALGLDATRDDADIWFDFQLLDGNDSLLAVAQYKSGGQLYWEQLPPATEEGQLCRLFADMVVESIDPDSRWEINQNEVCELHGPWRGAIDEEIFQPSSWHIQRDGVITRILETNPIKAEFDDSLRARRAAVYYDVEQGTISSQPGEIVWGENGIFKYWPNTINPLIDPPLGLDDLSPRMRLWAECIGA